MTAMTKLRIAVLGHLAAANMSTRELADACDRAPDELSPVLCRLLDIGFVSCAGYALSALRGAKPRIYSITDAGRIALENAPKMDDKGNRVRALCNTSERQKAKDAGERVYRGKPCPYGHIGLRYVSNYTCIECAYEAVYSRIAKRAAA